jgi:ATP-dependent DNA ligase
MQPGLAQQPASDCLFYASSGGYARIVSIAKAKVGFIEPMLTLAVTKLPEGVARSYELKFDGYRAIGVKAAGKVRLFSRNEYDLLRECRPSCLAVPVRTQSF